MHFITLVRNCVSLLFILIILAGCVVSDDCIDPDDFGFYKMTIGAAGYRVAGEEDSQYSQWIYSNLVINDNGEPLLITVSNDSAWTSWFCNKETQICDRSLNLDNCQAADTDKTSKGTKWCPDPDHPERIGPTNNFPCIFRKGLGLYGLMTDRTNNTDVNQNQDVILNPCSINACTFHLGDEDENLVDLGGERTGGYHDNQVNPTYYKGGLYFKLLDNYYDDNAGSYRITIKSGAVPPNPGPVSKVVGIIVGKIQDVSKQIYQNIIRDNLYLSIVRITMVLFIMFSGIGFALGLIKSSQQEFLIRTFKLVIITQLITAPSSWNFFNTYFFQIFTQGFYSAIGIVMSAVSGGFLSDTGSLTFFDGITNIFFSKETHCKIASLLFAKYFPIGLLSIFIIYLGFFVFVIAIVQAIVFYLLSVMAIGIMTITAPIFISCLLFKQTKSLFDGWLTQMISFTMQPLLVFAGIGFMLVAIIQKFQKLLGFQVCPQNIISVAGLDILTFWKPVSIPSPPVYKEIYVPAIPGDDQCSLPYICVKKRYVQLPFLDPSDPDDQSLINIFMAGDYYMLLVQFMLLALLMYLMYRFNDLIPGIAKSIAGGGTSSTNIADVSKVIEGDLLKGGSLTSAYISTLRAPGKAMGKARNYITNTDMYKKHIGSRIDTVGKKLEDWKEEKRKWWAGEDEKYDRQVQLLKDKQNKGFVDRLKIVGYGLGNAARWVYQVPGRISKTSDEVGAAYDAITDAAGAKTRTWGDKWAENRKRTAAETAKLDEEIKKREARGEGAKWLRFKKGCGDLWADAAGAVNIPKAAGWAVRGMGKGVEFAGRRVQDVAKTARWAVKKVVTLDPIGAAEDVSEAYNSANQKFDSVVYGIEEEKLKYGTEEAILKLKKEKRLERARLWEKYSPSSRVNKWLEKREGRDYAAEMQDYVGGKLEKTGEHIKDQTVNKYKMKAAKYVERKTSGIIDFTKDVAKKDEGTGE